MLNVFQQNIAVGKAELNREESHHLVAVRRARQGEAVRLLDGQGAVGEGIVSLADPKRAVVDVQCLTVHKRPVPQLCLLQALPKGKTMEFVVQKAAELGVARIIPLHTRNSESRIDDARAAKKTGKWRQVAVESLKQCGNPFLPEINEPVRVEDIRVLPPGELRIVASLQEGARSLGQITREHPKASSVAIAIGPEGDFDASEYQLLHEFSFLPATLGPNVLRLETAAIAAIALISELYRAE